MKRFLAQLTFASAGVALLGATAFGSGGPGGGGMGPEVSLSIRKATSEEPGNQANQHGGFVIRRTGSTSQSLSVAVRWGGTATRGQDYQESLDVFTLKGGEAGITVPVMVKDDTEAEADETVTLEILPMPGYGIGQGGPLTVVIQDNDEGNGGGIGTIGH